MYYPNQSFRSYEAIPLKCIQSDQAVVKALCVSEGDICYFYAGPIISEHCKGKLENSHTHLV